MDWLERADSIMTGEQSSPWTAEDVRHQIAWRKARDIQSCLADLLKIVSDRSNRMRSDAPLFADPDFQSALIEVLREPGEERDWILEELKNDKKKRRKSTRRGDLVYYEPEQRLDGILAAAIESGCGLPLVSAILDTGYNPNTFSDRNDSNIRYDGNTPVESAIISKNPEILQALIKRGAELDSDHLRGAIDQESNACIDVLLSSGLVHVRVNENRKARPSPNVYGGFVSGSRNQYCPMLVYAAKKGDLSTVEKMVTHGANINAPSWNGDAISLFGKESWKIHPTGEIVGKMLALGATISSEASLRIVKDGDAAAIKLLIDVDCFPTKEALTSQLAEVRSWDEASRLIIAGADLGAEWKHSHPRRLPGKRYTQPLTTIAWLSDALGPAPDGLVHQSSSSAIPQTYLPVGAPSLLRVVLWGEIASKDPARAASDPLCPHPDMAWSALLAAGDAMETWRLDTHFTTAQDRERLDHALVSLAGKYPIDLNRKMRDLKCDGTVQKEGVGARLLLGKWSTAAALAAFETCGGRDTAPESGTWHGLIAGQRPIVAEVKDAREDRVRGLDAMGWIPTKDDIAAGRKDSVRILMATLQAARNAAKSADAPKKTSRRRHRA